ncbi:universal stress protein [Pseudonocardia sp.]|uniref:universal stress protein n=1 Tax=Pseudonocardia sp. TaxID=60912 RepID=UPI0025FD0B44|nr:universal stress protein [Pseudonocardia sp.]
MSAHPMNTHRTVVVGVDGSEDSLRAVRWGADEAARRSVPLRLVHAFDRTAEHVVGLPALGEQDRDILLEQARRLLTEAAAVAETAFPGLEVQAQLVVGYPIPVLADESGRAQLVVLGSAGRGRFLELLAGSVASGLAAHGRCPVVVVRGAEQDRSAPVVVGIDGTPASEAAIAFAFETASVRHAPLVAVHAWQTPLVGTVPPDPAVVTAAEGVAHEILAERLAGWTEKYPDVHVRRAVVDDRPAPLLVREARGAQLLVVGSRAHGRLAGAFLGSVGHALVHRAPCPVAVVRPESGA